MVKFTFSSSKNKYRVCAKGHAEYNNGNDIVCSAISCLLYSFVKYASEKADVVCNYQLNPGDSIIVVDGDVEEAYIMLKGGIRMLCEAYPKNVRINTDILQSECV